MEPLWPNVTNTCPDTNKSANYVSKHLLYATALELCHSTSDLIIIICTHRSLSNDQMLGTYRSAFLSSETIQFHWVPPAIRVRVIGVRVIRVRVVALGFTQ